ncbi:unnamed protein product [Sphagnum troendelagicum]
MSFGVLQPTERRFESAPGRADEKSCWNSSQLCTDLVSDAAKLEQILRSVELDRRRIELCNVAHICVESRGLIREPLPDKPWR